MWWAVRASSRSGWRQAPHEGAWAAAIDASNALVDDLVRPVSEVGRVLSAVAEGDLSPRMDLRAQAADGNGHPLRGEFLKVGRTVNNLVDQLDVHRRGHPGGQ